MSTTMRNIRLAGYGEPLSRGRSGRTRLEQWAYARPGLSAMSLTVGYLIALGALVAVLSANALWTPVGIAVLLLFAAVVVVYCAVAYYIVLPERPRS